MFDVAVLGVNPQFSEPRPGTVGDHPAQVRKATPGVDPEADKEATAVSQLRQRCAGESFPGYL